MSKVRGLSDGRPEEGRAPRLVLVTGGEGMLGDAFAREQSNFEQFLIQPVGRSALDVCSPSSTSAWTERLAGGWVVHCAAMVDVEGCARDPERARSVIVEGARNVAVLAREAGARVVYPQSFLTYDGAVNPIPEDETPRPLSLYGELKLEAERVISEILDDPLIVRMAGFFGGEAKDKNFVGRIIPALQAAIERGETVFKVGDRVWQPTWTRDLAFNTLHLMASGVRGSYQMASIGQASFHEIAREIVQALGWQDRIRIEAVSAAAVAGSELGRRPDCAVLSCERLTAQNLNLQRPWAATLHAYLRGPYFDQHRNRFQ